MSSSSNSDSDSEEQYEFSIDNIPCAILNLDYNTVCLYEFSSFLQKHHNNIFLELYNWIAYSDIVYIFKRFFPLRKKIVKQLNIDCMEYFRVQVVNLKTFDFARSYQRRINICTLFIVSHKYFLAKE